MRIASRLVNPTVRLLSWWLVWLIYPFMSVSFILQVPDGMKVAVVSVVGAFRTGKSFLLTFLLRYLRYG